MLNNLLYLIDTNTVNLIVTLFTMTINKNNQLVLRFVQELGPLEEIKNFFSGQAYIAVKEKEYQEQNSEFVKSVLPKQVQNYIVSTVINNEEFADLEPFGICVCKNKTKFLKRKKPVGDNDFVVMAALNYADVKAQNDVLTIITGDSKNCKLYEFEHLENANFFDIEKLPRENIATLDDTPFVEKEKHLTKFGDEIINYKRIWFDKSWRNYILISMKEFFLSGDEKLIPQIDGSWSKEYISGISFPYLRYFGNIPNKSEWKNFLKNDNIFPLEFEKMKKVG